MVSSNLSSSSLSLDLDQLQSQDWLTPFLLAPIPSVRVFERQGLQLDLSFTRPLETPALLLVTATTTNSSKEDVTHFVCQAAVPKVPLRLKLRLTYNHACQPVQEIFEVDNLPVETWQ